MRFDHDDPAKADELVERNRAFMDEVVTLESKLSSWAAET